MRARLQWAALELFREHGYDRTTAAQIAARVGVTERTFFRHFADKREALFGGEEVLGAALLDAIAEAPAQLGAMETLFRAFRSVLPLLEANRAFSVPRQSVVAATPALQERETAKHALLAARLAGALRARKIDATHASLAATIGMAAFVQATLAWIEDDGCGLPERLERARRDLRRLLTDPEA